MEYTRFRSVIPKPCACCNAQELRLLQDAQVASDEQHWIYEVPVCGSCNRCKHNYVKRNYYDIAFLLLGFTIVLSYFSCYRSILLAWVAFCYQFFRPPAENRVVKIPISVKTVGTVERSVHAASVAAKGSEFRAHGTFIHHLSLCDSYSEVLKQALCTWAPAAMMAFLECEEGVSRLLSDGHPIVGAEPPETTDTHSGNPDVENGAMKGTRLNGDEYGDEDRLKSRSAEEDTEKVLAYQIGPDLIPTEVMASTEGNLKCGLSKRVRPLEFRANRNLVRRINNAVKAMCTHVFTAQKIKKWREQNPVFDEFKSKKWDSKRWRHGFEECLSDTHSKIEQEFQIKLNEALPAKDKAPRPIIQCGDKAQVMMQLPVKCFEELLFEAFESASIKHCPKHDAMKRVAKHLRQKEKCTVIEGDGSAWDACCNATIRGMTENMVLKRIISVLGEDPEVPKDWLDAVMADMEKPRLKGKAKVEGRHLVSPIRVMIDSIRQSGHRGTSCFNYFINLICWISVLAENPEYIIQKFVVDSDEPVWYKSTNDGRWYQLKFAFEGDDSVLSTTEKVDSRLIEKAWTSMGFRMKLVYVEQKMTFTGFDFLCDEYGPVGAFCPEIPRNIASSSWTCSTLVKRDPSKVNEVGMSAMYARAENFKDCGPLCNYFAQLGLAHYEISGDMGLGEDQACALGVHETNSIVRELKRLANSCGILDPDMRKLVNIVVPDWTAYYETSLLTCVFDDPLSTATAKQVLPLSLWDPGNYSKARR